MLAKKDISRISGIDLEMLDGYNKVVELCGEEVDALPNGLDFLGLSLKDCPSLTELPEDLPIKYLSVMGCPNLKHLPEGLELAHLYLFDSDIETLPEKSSCFVTLVLINCPHIKRIPACCKIVARDFLVENCPGLSSVPDLNIVHGEFNLINTQVTSLPEHLKIGGSLWVSGTPIETLPANIRVGADIILGGCKSLRSLPERLMVNGNLDLSETSILKLPEGLIVKGNLNLTDTAVCSLPENLVIGGNIIASKDVVSGLNINHEVPDELTDLIWEGGDYIYMYESHTNGI